MSAFITGSHAYGEPRPDSDIDLVIEASDDLLDELRDIVGDEYGSGSLRLLCVEEDTGQRIDLILVRGPAFAAWRAATEELSQSAPVSRDEAVLVIRDHLLGAGRKETP